MAAEAATKRCTGCRESKPLEAFSLDRRKRDGRQSRCKDCAAAANATYRAANRDKIAARNAARRTAKRSAGVCWDCSAAAAPGQTRCPKHAAAHAARAATRYAADPEKARASSGAARRKAYTAAKAEGRCVWQSGYGCTAPADEGYTLCNDHRAEQAARNARRSARATAAMLAEAAEWDIYRCHLCELPILPDDEMHRDHLVPVVHGGVDRCETTGTTMLRPAHASCNVSRHDDHILDAVARLNHTVMENLT